MSRRAIFMDRDGTVCEEMGYVNHLSRSRLLPRSLEAIRLANEHGYLVIIATNQSGVARGLFTDAMVQEVHRQLCERAAAGGARIDALYYCPHHPREGTPPWRADCDCRKPRPGMLRRAAAEHEIDLSRSWMVGDGFPDIEAGAAAGVRVVQVLTGYGRGLAEHHQEEYRHRPDHTAEDLLDAVRHIVARDREEAR
jgi:D-glycero-D-manno-heptose 1,7-bisphosphate phosphatase